mmetsp:Transcript_24047/g.44938  ORF Transcript_24047/g.44938 Transcript_24047/m.44938 type:complete len:217 (-) Transcript_24047:231-881(-)|eukprot:CAMPEP_0170176412 /NCGR_PEP_ID=MMETSP0040_2-20121228/9291_1 /TAXON_ID=641309 /ORGANISM="Lotharella oceanica, Strain CCMP622" /LENGTH=216 /DNA_ID=CAMNT_0010418719 /DNA_START=158 /DNA_END=808 /DNA_ORIENTATION=+
MADSKGSIKCVLLGDSDVGKTCLVERFLRENWKMDTMPTIGTAFGLKTVTTILNSGPKAGKKISRSLGVWDTAGSERYYSMTRHYYHGAHAALVCYDLTNRKTWEKVGFWVSELRAVEPSVIISLVGTKFDLISEGKSRGVESRVVTAYANKINASTFETSAKTGQNVELTFSETLRHLLESRPEMMEIGKPVGYDTPFKVTSKNRNEAGERKCPC